MKLNTMLLIAVAFLLCSCAQSGINQGQWIEKEQEKLIISVEKDKGKLWLNYFNRPMEIIQKGSESYIEIRKQKIPLMIDLDKEILYFNNVAYIPLSKSMKGQFAGRWKSESGDTVFHVQLDDNMDLTWDIMNGTEKAIRFWPKPTAKGFYFTFGEEELSFTLEDGYLLDAEGKRYFKTSNL